MGTALPLTTMPPCSGMSTVSSLGRPTYRPWVITTRAGGDTASSSRRYPPTAAAAAPVAGSSEIGPTGKMLRASKRSPAPAGSAVVAT